MAYTLWLFFTSAVQKTHSTLPCVKLEDCFSILSCVSFLGVRPVPPGCVLIGNYLNTWRLERDYAQISGPRSLSLSISFLLSPSLQLSRLQYFVLTPLATLGPWMPRSIPSIQAYLAWIPSPHSTGWKLCPGSKKGQSQGSFHLLHIFQGLLSFLPDVQWNLIFLCDFFLLLFFLIFFRQES